MFNPHRGGGRSLVALPACSWWRLEAARNDAEMLQETDGVASARPPTPTARALPSGIEQAGSSRTSRTLAMAILRAYPLATSLKRRKVSIWSSNSGTRYMG